MNKSFTRILLTACTFGCLATVAIAKKPPEQVYMPPVQLHIEAPNSEVGLALLSESGWPLTIRMVVDFPEGEDFPAYAVQPNFPVRGRWGFIIFDDPDGCLNPPAPSWVVKTTEECGWKDSTDYPDWDWTTDWVKPVSDEVYMEFWPDVDMAGVEDDTGNEDRQADLVESYGDLDFVGGRGPEFQKWGAADCLPGNNDIYDEDTNEDGGCIRFGPQTGGETTDGFGFGADDDIPGLVIIAEYGVGLVFDEPNFELDYRLVDNEYRIGAVNLAGLVNSVSYDLSILEEGYTLNKPGKPKKGQEIITEQARIWAHMNMEDGVLRHLIQYDACTGNVTQDFDDPKLGVCDGNDLWRIDGGPIEEPPQPFGWPFNRGDTASIHLLESTTYTLKVFLVAGQAPDRLFDEDGDGDVDSADAVLAGLTLLSNEDSISLLQLSKGECHGGGSGVFEWGLDGNPVIDPYACPGGAGDLSRPPR